MGVVLLLPVYRLVSIGRKKVSNYEGSKVPEKFQIDQRYSDL